MTLYGCLLKAVDPAVTLAAILSNREPFLAPPHARVEASRAKASWAGDSQSDPIAALRAYDAWWALQGQGKFNCRE